MRVIFFIGLFVSSRLLFPQNLVPNDGFEIYNTCPIYTGEWSALENWFSPLSNPSTPDYYNVCSTMGTAGVPENAFGYQLSKSGNGYAGIYMSQQMLLNDFREYLTVKLMDTLHPNIKYYISFNVSLSKKTKDAVSTIGLLFSKDTGFKKSNYLINELPQFQTNQPFLEQGNWMLIEGSFYAQGGELFATIGNFKTDDSSGIASSSLGISGYSYYYIDDVCVSLNPTDCGIDTTTTSVINIDKPQFEFKVFPNPARDYIQLRYIIGDNEGLRYEIVNMLGQQIKSIENLNPYGFEQINTATFSEGVYLIKIFRYNDLVETKRFIIQR